MADKLLPMTKDGETITVHPLAVEDHKSLGWKVVGEVPAEAAALAEADAKPEGKSRRSRSKKNKSAAGEGE